MARTFIEKEKQKAEHGENYIINREDTGIQGLSPKETQTDASITSGVGKDRTVLGRGGRDGASKLLRAQRWFSLNASKPWLLWTGLRTPWGCSCDQMVGRSGSISRDTLGPGEPLMHRAPVPIYWSKQQAGLQ